MTPILEMSLAGGPDDVARAAEHIDGFCADQGFSPRIAFELNLAIDELATNTLSYGFAGVDHDPVVLLRVGFAEDGMIQAELVDNGVAYNPFEQAPPPPLTGTIEERPIGGLGVYFVHTLMDEVGYSRDDGYNRITLRRRVSSG